MSERRDEGGGFGESPGPEPNEPDSLDKWRLEIEARIKVIETVLRGLLRRNKTKETK